MVDLSKFKSEEFEGVIVDAKELLLEKWLTIKPNPLKLEQLKKWKNLERKNICVTIKSGNAIITDQFMIPHLQGWIKSNLKKFVEKNDLPPNTKDWNGKKVVLKVDKSGFLRVAY